MAYDNKAFTEKIAEKYAELLTSRLPGATFFIGEDSVVNDALKNTPMRMVRDFGRSELSLIIESYFKPDGSLNEELIAPSYANALADAVTDAAKTAGDGKLWIFHKIIPKPLDTGAAVVDFIESGKTGVFGQSWRDPKEKKTAFTAMTNWGIWVE
jgi:hypothetical protein